jgi:FkbM family methyltransferase
MASFDVTTPRTCVVITTYSRPDGLGRLLDDIERERLGDLDVRVYDDATPHADGAIERRLKARGWTYRRATTNHGKRGWWRWWNTILEDLRSEPASLYVVLQDDMRLCERFFHRSHEQWSAIDDPRKASLYLHLSEQRAELGSSCWTPVHAEQAGGVVRCGWVDLAAVVCDRRLFEALAWRLVPIPERRWDGREELSSGVGQQISLRAYRLGLGMYHVKRSLAVHDDSPSLMNPAARQRWTMDTVGFIDGDEAARGRARACPPVFASLATIKTREHGLQRVVESLLPQVDGLGVYLNGYDRVPPFLECAGVEVARSQSTGDRGDAGKFFWAGTNTGYQLVCDDDIDYPHDYVQRLVEGIERHERRAVVGFHGSVLHGKIVDYYLSRTLTHLSRHLTADCPVHVLGTGVSGYHTSAIRVGPEDFASPNMADIWFGLLGQRQRVPFMLLRHEADWLRELPDFREGSLYVQGRRRAAIRGAGPSAETLAVRAHGRWELHGRSAVAGSSPQPRMRTAALPSPEFRPPPVQPLIHVRVAGPKHTGTLVLPDRDHITAAIQKSGTYYERDLLDAIRARSVRDTFVDVGAHYGNHTAFFALECAAERVVAIEPNAPAFAGLLETVAANGLQPRVATYRLAAHPHWRSVNVSALPWLPRPGNLARSNSGAVMIMPATGDGDAAAAPLDEILDGIDPIGLVKVDAVGLSPEILCSGRRMLERDRPLVAAEAASPAQRQALRALLAPLGYQEGERYGWTPIWLWEPLGA